MCAGEFGIDEIVVGFFSVDDKLFDFVAGAFYGDIEHGIAIFKAFDFFLAIEENGHKGVEFNAIGQKCHSCIYAKHHRHIAGCRCHVGLMIAKGHAGGAIKGAFVGAKQRLCAIHGAEP